MSSIFTQLLNSAYIHSPSLAFHDPSSKLCRITLIQSFLDPVDSQTARVEASQPISVPNDNDRPCAVSGFDLRYGKQRQMMCCLMSSDVS